MLTRHSENNIISGLPDQSFKIRATTPLGKEVIKQPKAQILSFYKQVKNGTMNLGFYPQIPQTIALNLNHLGTYSFNLKLVAEPLGSQYAHQVQTIQKNRLRQLKLSPNHLQGTIKTTRPGILTSSISVLRWVASHGQREKGSASPHEHRIYWNQASCRRPSR